MVTTSVLNEWHDWTMHSLIKHKLDSNLPTGCTAIQAQVAVEKEAAC